MDRLYCVQLKATSNIVGEKKRQLYLFLSRLHVFYLNSVNKEFQRSNTGQRQLYFGRIRFVQTGFGVYAKTGFGLHVQMLWTVWFWRGCLGNESKRYFRFR